MKIKLVVPIPIPPQSRGMFKQLLAIRRRVAGPQTSLDMVIPRHGPPSMVTISDRFLSAQGVLPEVMQAAEEGYNAVIVDCCGDQLYPEILDQLSIPLVPPLHSTLQLAGMLCRRCSIITSTPGQAKLYRTLVDNYGFNHKVVSVRETPPCHLNDYPNSCNVEDGFKGVLLQTGQEVLQEGAEGIILGCTLLTQDRWLQERLGVPVLAPGDVAVKTAEMLLQLGLTYYPERRISV